MKKIKYFITVAILITACIVGFRYFNHKAISESVDDYMKAFLSGNLTVLKEQETADGVRQMEEELKSIQLRQFRTYFKGSGLTVNEEELEDIYQAYHQALSTLDYQITIDNISDNRAVIRIKCHQFDMKSLEDKATKSALEIIEKKNVTRLDRAAQIFVNEMVNELENATAGIETETTKITFVKDDSYWKPKDTLEFFETMNSVAVSKL